MDLRPPVSSSSSSSSTVHAHPYTHQHHNAPRHGENRARAFASRGFVRPSVRRALSSSPIDVDVEFDVDIDIDIESIGAASIDPKP
jgi:hypothetical protein